ncbi:hypothetical protein POSPLADRAFT_1049159 [Postia placenta MAD-698-R-SB12]|uniref:Uncharacterized protein n=1 Tax=Postia placenta MAD-698-R-SB12 TaxID=670580 RepID=A0A1X6MS15_9APHY|nr:hypothetical protein POSPLADRAFT_1049159 [Postia placenta MAD-698-R-SB12]OSX59016.1 hypothetical protein POSPLADRAFT_1049159 [Postia placenta MAD-698-R-SB12]
MFALTDLLVCLLQFFTTLWAWITSRTRSPSEVDIEAVLVAYSPTTGHPANQCPISKGNEGSRAGIVDTSHTPAAVSPGDPERYIQEVASATQASPTQCNTIASCSSSTDTFDCPLSPTPSCSSPCPSLDSSIASTPVSSCPGTPQFLPTVCGIAPVGVLGDDVPLPPPAEDAHLEGIKVPKCRPLQLPSAAHTLVDDIRPPAPPPADDAEADPFCLSAGSYSADGNWDTTSPADDAGPYSFSIYSSAAKTLRGHPGRRSKSAASSKPTSAAISSTPAPSSIHSTPSPASAVPPQDAVKPPPSSKPRAPVPPAAPRGVRPLRLPRGATKPCSVAPPAPLTPTAPLVIRKRKPVPSRAAPPRVCSAPSDATAERRASQLDDLIALVDAAITTGSLDAFAALGSAPHVGALGAGHAGSRVGPAGDVGHNRPRKMQQPICQLDLGEMGAAPRGKARLDLEPDGSGGDVMQCYGLAF